MGALHALIKRDIINKDQLTVYTLLLHYYYF